MVKKVLRILKGKTKETLLTLRTFGNKELKKSNYSRWKDSKALYESWDERTETLASLVKPNSKVLEFGAGRLVLKQYLPENCEYLHSDLVKRAEDTIVIDLNKTLPEIPKVDFIVFSGVLEYVNDIERLLVHLSKKTNHIVFSYAIKDNFESVNYRRSQGWVSDFSNKDFLVLAQKINGDLEIVGDWKKQSLYKLSL